MQVENGCMWFVPGSHKEEKLRPHRPTKPGHHVLMTDQVNQVQLLSTFLTVF